MALVTIVTISVHCHGGELEFHTEGIKVPGSTGEVMYRLNRDRSLSYAAVFAFLKELPPTMQLTAKYQAKDFLELANFNPSKCLKQEFRKYGEFCASTKVRNFKGFCEHVHGKLLLYCDGNKSRVVREHVRRELDRGLSDKLREHIAELDQVWRRGYDEQAVASVKRHCEDMMGIESGLAHLLGYCKLVREYVDKITRLPFSEHIGDCEIYIQEL